MDLKERMAWRAYQANPCPDTAFAWARVHARQVSLENLPIKEIDGLGGRAKNLLFGAGIDTFEKLTQCNKVQIKNILGCGPAYRNQILGFLQANGIKLRQEPKTSEEWEALYKAINLHQRSYAWHFINRLHRMTGRPFNDRFWR